MLKSIDTDGGIDKEEAKTRREALDLKLAALQRDCRTAGIPIVILVDGPDGAGKGDQLGRIIAPLDPRGFAVHAQTRPSEDEQMRPFLWRFWQRLPASGAVALFDRGWYQSALLHIVNGKKSAPDLLEDIASFERTLVDNGAVVVKFWLHISRKAQKKRLEKLEEDKVTRWRVRPDDWEHYDRYEEFREVASAMIAMTDSPVARWHVVPADSGRFAEIRIKELLVDTLTSALSARSAAASVPAPKTASVKKVKKSEPVDTIPDLLGRTDLSQKLDRTEYDEKIDDLQRRLRELEHRIYTARVPVVIGFEGWDAAGKGGAIRRLTDGLDPRGYAVHPVAAPTPIERSHHWLWRFWRDLPKAGHIGIYDRTWYGRVLVERVEGFCSEEAWRRSYREIVDFERQLVDSGAVVCKFWLAIDKETQLQRFTERQNTPEKQWKITDEDWRNREKWDAYLSSVNEMLLRTDTPWAPWSVVPGNDKLFARVFVLETVVKAIEERLKR